MQIAIDFAKIFEKSRNFCQWSAKGGEYLPFSLKFSQILVFSRFFSQTNSMPKRQHEKTNMARELPVRKRSQTESIQSTKRLQKLNTEQIRSAGPGGIHLHNNPCKILPPSNPSIGIRFNMHKDRLERQNSSTHVYASQKGKASAKQSKLISGPAAHSRTREV